MSSHFNSSISHLLAIPNLQGKIIDSTGSALHYHWLPIQSTVSEQVQTVQYHYNHHEFLLGSSFGALAAWKFALEHRPDSLKGIILIDVLPSLPAFPKHKRILLRILQHMPTSLIQPLYQHFRHANFQEVQQRLQSILRDFPEKIPNIPILVLSKNAKFHQEWQRLSRTHLNIEAAMYTSNIHQQISDWQHKLENGTIQ